MKRIYYDALFTGLVPVGTPTPAERQDTWAAEVLETTGPYKKGETVEDFLCQFVHKAGVREGFIRVCQWGPGTRWMPQGVESNG